MLSKRYLNDGKALLKLNHLQKEMKGSVDAKMSSGEYQFEQVECSICGCEDFEPIAEKDRYGLYLPVVACRKCGLVQSNPRLNKEAYDRFYNEEYRPLYTGVHEPSENIVKSQIHKAKLIFEFIYGHTSLKPESCFVLEVGCGAGGIVRYFRDMGCRKVVGCDLGEQYLEFGRREFGLDLRVGTLADIELDEQPDVIIYSHVLEHILNVNAELQNIRSFLNDSGVLYVELPGVKNIRAAYNSDFLLLLQNAHTYHFTLRSLQNLLAMNGFSLIFGDEYVRSVFAKSSVRHKFVSDYFDVMNFLRLTERHRHVYNILNNIRHPYRYASRKILAGLEVMGLKPAVKRLLNR